MKDTSVSRTFLSGHPDAMPQRTTHGSCAWSLPSRRETLRQPQDGAGPAAVARSMDGRMSGNPLLGVEEARADDARLSGNLRSLARRVTGLNVMQARPTESLLRAEALPVRYFAEPQAVRSAGETQRVATGFARPRGVKSASGIASRTQVA